MINGIKRFLYVYKHQCSVFPRIYIFVPVIGAGQETCYYRVKASKSGLFGKQVFVCVQVLIKLVEDQFSKNP